MEFYLVTVGFAVKLFGTERCNEISFLFFLLLFWVLFLSEIVVILFDLLVLFFLLP